MFAWGWDGEQSWGAAANGYRVSLGNDENFLKLGSDDGCTTS